MRVLEKLEWKRLRAEQSHLASNDKMAAWENEEAMRIDGDDAIGPICFTKSVLFLMKQAKLSQQRLQLFKQLRTECHFLHDDCRNAIETEKLAPGTHARLQQKMRDAANCAGVIEEWVGNETEWFNYIDEFLSDVFERFTALYTRTDPLKDDHYDIPPEETDSGEFVPKPIFLTRH